LIAEDDRVAVLYTWQGTHQASHHLPAGRRKDCGAMGYR